MTIIPPGGTIGILGGGQLGRMTALAAARLGYRVHIFTPEPDSPAAQVAAAVTVAEFTDTEALDRFAAVVDVVTLEWENVPLGSVEHLAGQVKVSPSSRVLAVTQHRVREKEFINAQGIPTAPFLPVTSAATLKVALAQIGCPAVLKTATLGYDGKGQVRIETERDTDAAWTSAATQEAILEGFVDFAVEISVVAARGQDGTVALYPAVQNQHVHHILDTTIVPAAIRAQTAEAAAAIARRLITALDVVGLLAVEMFVTPEGEVLVNELAPRPHNSGHWTIDACACSQFEQLVRAVCGLPLGSPERFADAEMRNLIGEDVNAWPALMADPAARLHLYGKTEVRPGRKMGHVTRLRARGDS